MPFGGAIRSALYSHGDPRDLGGGEYNHVPPSRERFVTRAENITVYQGVVCCITDPIPPLGESEEGPPPIYSEWRGGIPHPQNAISHGSPSYWGPY